MFATFLVSVLSLLWQVLQTDASISNGYSTVTVCGRLEDYVDAIAAIFYEGVMYVVKPSWTKLALI